ncbi:MAG: arylsulfatase [Microthrixaceae bacterium]
MFGTSVQADVWGIEIVNKSKLSTGGSQLVGVTGNEMAGNNLAGNDAIGNDAISDDEISDDPVPRESAMIGRTLADSVPHFIEPPHPAPGSPNVLIVVLDDTGYAQLGCFGSDIDTPNIDRLAADGLKFTNFHVTPLCSPTRASLLTGRSPHAVGMRALSNFQTGFPNQTGHISNSAATIAEVLRSHGYGTFCVGKWHLAPMEQCSAAGPFDQWPLGRGFDRFYGFLEGETDQFHPDLVCDNHPIDPPRGPEDGYHLSEDLVDQLLRMLSDSRGVRPDRPFFGYLAFGATHAPHQAPERYLEKYRGRYDDGWDIHRQQCYERQLDMGVIPPGTQLAARNPGVDAWDDLPENHRRFASRLQEAFAAFLDHTDDQIGRLIEGLDSLGQLDDTIIIVMSDNGASQEGGPFGVTHEMKFFNGILETPDEAIGRIDDIGGPYSHTNYPWGWAQCGNTPFRWYKGNTHEGGVHVPLIVHWPSGTRADQRGSIRDQFTNVSDVAPTIYELVGIDAPEVFNGHAQLPVTGQSFASAMADDGAEQPNTLQYFEMIGSRAIVEGDWKAVCRHSQGDDYDAERWELFNLADDRSECVDLADVHRDRLDAMITLWWSEAQRHGVLPLDDRLFELFGVRFRDNSPHPSAKRYRYRPPMSPMPAQASAPIGGRNFDLTAHVTMTAQDEGVLYASGTANSGLSVFVQDGRLILDYNAFGDHTIVESSSVIDTGSNAGNSNARNSNAGNTANADEADQPTVASSTREGRRVELTVRVRRGTGREATAALLIDGVECGSVDIPMYLSIMSSVGASVGYDHGSPVSLRYESTYPFTGTLHQIDIELVPPQDQGEQNRIETATNEAEARAAMARQ